jgi:YihY family inner membrane protein
LEGDDALETLRHVGWGRLTRDAFERFRAADGFSHARALAFQVTLTVPPAVIALVGLAAALDQERPRRILQDTLVGLSPGPTGEVLTQAFRQAAQTTNGSSGRFALVLGLVTALASLTLAMAQVERGANRLYGVERDRPALSKYAHGLALGATVGLLVAGSAVVLVAGRALGEAVRSDFGPLAAAWAVGRWPLGALLAMAGFAALFKESPRRRQPSPSWLLAGSVVTVVLWLAFTALLVLYLTASRTFGDAYGPLAGIVGGMLWALLTSLALYLGLAFAAQLEAVRAGVSEPRTGEDANAPQEPARRSLG